MSVSVICDCEAVRFSFEMFRLVMVYSRRF